MLLKSQGIILLTRPRDQREEEHDVEVEDPVEEVEVPWLGAVEVGAVRGEHVVRDYVERRRHDPPVECGVEKYLQSQKELHFVDDMLQLNAFIQLNCLNVDHVKTYLWD